MDEVEAGPDGLAAVRQADLFAGEGVKPAVVGGRMLHMWGDHDAIVIIECAETSVEGAVVQRVEQEAVRRVQAKL